MLCLLTSNSLSSFLLNVVFIKESLNTFNDLANVSESINVIFSFSIICLNCSFTYVSGTFTPYKTIIVNIIFSYTDNFLYSSSHNSSGSSNAFNIYSFTFCMFLFFNLSHIRDITPGLKLSFVITST